MCLSVPVKILKLKNNKAIAGFMGRKEEFNIDLVPGIKINNYALASNGFIVRKISTEEAQEIFKIIKPRQRWGKPAKGRAKSKTPRQYSG
jgi:hydrogenase assembly chaperone HypC/HupF